VGSEQLVFVDETGVTTNLTRPYGRAPRGQRVQAAAPANWENVTLLVGLRHRGVLALLAVEGASEDAVFQTYVEEVLVPELHAGDVVV
jgi:hypothetical protein